MTLQTIIIEPFSAGHRPIYVRWIAQALANARVDVAIVGGAELIQHAELRSLLEESALRPQSRAGRCVGIALDVPSPTPARRGRVAQWRFELGMRKWFEAAYAAVCDADVDSRAHTIVIVPYLDYCFHAIAALGSPFGATPWCAITMRTEFARHRRDLRLALRHTLLRRILAEKTMLATFSIDPRCEAQVSTADAIFNKLRYLADPAEIGKLPDRETARRRLDIPQGKRALLLFGSIDLRKGLQEMLAGLAQCADVSQWSVVIAGKQTENAKDVIAGLHRGPAPAYSLHVFDEVVRPEDVPVFFASADVVWVGYPGHRAMSGVLVQAAMAGKPVVAQIGTLIGELVAGTGIGVVCEVSNPSAVAAALQRAASPATVEIARLTGPARFAGHTPEAFGSRIVRTVLEPRLSAAALAATR